MTLAESLRALWRQVLVFEVLYSPPAARVPPGAFSCLWKAYLALGPASKE